MRKVAPDISGGCQDHWRGCIRLSSLYRCSLDYSYRPREANSRSKSTTGVCIMNRADLERGYGNFLMDVLVACVFHFTNLDFKRSLQAS